MLTHKCKSIVSVLSCYYKSHRLIWKLHIIVLHLILAISNICSLIYNYISLPDCQCTVSNPSWNRAEYFTGTPPDLLRETREDKAFPGRKNFKEFSLYFFQKILQVEVIFSENRYISDIMV